MEIATLAVSLVALAISYVALVYTARARVRVFLVSNNQLARGQVTALRFRVTMRSHLKRSAADMRIYVNFPPGVEPLVIRHGSNLELSNSNSRPGKGGGKYLTATNMRVSNREPIKHEDFTVEVMVPLQAQTGRHRGWVTVFAHGSADDCGTDTFDFWVLP